MRVLVRKILYFVIVVALVFVIAGVLYPIFGPIGLGVAALVMLIPGRVAARGLHDFYLARRLIDDERYDEAVSASERFLETLRAESWRRWLILGAYGFYTSDIEAMAQNNLGVARMLQGDLDAAERALKDAVQRDHRYPMPFYNLAIVARARGDASGGDALMHEARKKGFKGGADDALISEIAGAYARFNARG